MTVAAEGETAMKRVGSILVLAVAAWAQTDEPGRGVARLGLLSGDVSIKRGDTAEWVAGVANGPLLAGDRVLSGVGSRAEVQFDWANLARLASNTEVRLTEIEQSRYQLNLARGLMTFAVVRESSAEVDINTPSVSVRPLKRGLYRVAVREEPDGPVTEISVRQGEVEVFSPRGSQRLRAGRTMLVRGALADPEFQNVADLSDDDWDRWNERRNRELLASNSYNYVSRDIYGVDDLDRHGSWVFAAPYGYVWTPRVAPGWAPYRAGRWSWVDFYGWTWISADPWGWAPYHYGRWFWNANRWCWWPGGVGVRTFWRPALVAWVGWGGVGVGVGFGGGWGRVGWVPLAPYEPFHPWYGRGWYGRGRVVNNTTIVNNINVTNIYRNARVDNGVTVVEAQQFGRGAVNPQRVRAMDLESVASARGPLPIVPDRASTRLVDREVGSIRESGGDRFYTRREAANVERVPFEEQRSRAAEIARSTFGERSGASETVQMPRNERVERVERSVLPGGSREQRADEGTRRVGEPGGGWRRVGEASPQVNGVESGRVDRFDRADRANREADGGWRRFGSSRADAADGSTGPDSPRYDSPRYESPRYDSRRSESPRYDSRGVDSSPRVDRTSPRYDGARESSPRAESPRYDSPRYDSPRTERSSPRYESPRVERSSPRMESPRFERSSPRMESPRFERSSPRMESPRGGGGGGGRAGGAGGGGATRSGGGGGGRRGQ
jgi:hypothetical protein